MAERATGPCPAPPGPPTATAFDASVLASLADGTRFLLLSFARGRCRMSHVQSRMRHGGVLLEQLLPWRETWRETSVDLLLDEPAECGTFCCRVWANTTNTSHHFRSFLEAHVLQGCKLALSDWLVVEQNWLLASKGWNDHSELVTTVDVHELVNAQGFDGSAVFTDAYLQRVNARFLSIPALASCCVERVGRARTMTINLNKAAMSSFFRHSVAATMLLARRLLAQPDMAGTELVLLEGEHLGKGGARGCGEGGRRGAGSIGGRLPQRKGEPTDGSRSVAGAPTHYSPTLPPPTHTNKTHVAGGVPYHAEPADAPPAPPPNGWALSESSQPPLHRLSTLVPAPGRGGARGARQARLPRALKHEPRVLPLLVARRHLAHGLGLVDR